MLYRVYTVFRFDSELMGSYEDLLITYLTIVLYIDIYIVLLLA